MPCHPTPVIVSRGRPSVQLCRTVVYVLQAVQVLPGPTADHE